MRPSRAIAHLAPLAFGALLLVAVSVALSQSGLFARSGSSSALSGTDLRGRPAPNFALADAHGDPVSLADLRGKAVALTFIYTSCPDLCPLTVAKLRQAYEQLGPMTSKVAFVAITVDPETDTPPRMEQYTQEMQMSGKWEFLTGTRAELTPIWSEYAVAPLQPQQAKLLLTDGDSATKSDPSFAAAHTLSVYLIDPNGHEQRLLDPDFTSQEVAHDLIEMIARRLGSMQAKRFG
jgi:protein SCO1